MRFTIKEKFFSLGQRFAIRDQDGDIAYQVEGKFLSIKDKLTIRDPQGSEVARIEQKLLSFVTCTLSVPLYAWEGAVIGCSMISLTFRWLE